MKYYGDMFIVQEIIELVNQHTEDISWIGSEDGKFAMSWDEFSDKFKDTNYDNGFGGCEIDPNLVVVMNDGRWADRGGYDGSEYFEEHWAQDGTTPEKKPNAARFSKIRTDDGGIGY